MSWITENPGRQMFTGSFHPIEESARQWEAREQWDKDIPLSYRFYVSNPMDILVRRSALHDLNIPFKGVSSRNLIMISK